MAITPVPRVAVIVVAAGSGTRLSAGAPKAFVGLDEHTILWHALRGVVRAPSAQVIVVAPADRVGDALTDVREVAGDRADLISVVEGGATRQASVNAGRMAVWPDVEIVLVHDAARALTPPDVFARVIEAIEGGAAAAIPTVPVVDTIKRVEGGQIIGVIDRSELAAAQTPQGFARLVFDAAYESSDVEFTDDAALIAESGHEVVSVEGDTLAFKITTPPDLDRARHLVSPLHAVPARRAVGPRIGVGTDVHAFGGEGTLWLAGLEWPGEAPLSGHSDGDAVAHAIVDALLSAAGIGDIGTHFGVDRPEFSGAHADAFLARTRELLLAEGWHIGNVSVQVQALRPRFSARRQEAEAALSAALGGASVSVSATTTDGLGFTGRGDGVTATAVALLQPA
ncbi:2-C-methyl-D-erythritol 4-phosphate cytidylyltransferase/2-C-methyl-D-erythritol 2,4-cyclodiphosphate synthase [Microbacterium endophyticum]|uniref:Bifunctional enzyme IspD/IspF n=1 Tax=Microbacterium endophyticum TaxID=1526412 RepID=A0A7W4V1A7_9MICO|nr:2-C-methyl-D-erythritol 4-phosphate cytidylyltransferase [Microbacterium endophyticum]MBB2975031.1 2-C-methyl-D-erythritol 4-phosphate cytidylyltransferase/2-C-methyl-D-erythritol 2,4-cyclodiphosphate synthase [Microbacterium endophyticum]NIK37429.1 2-C-methyl-D-erythritol 4-phosphate cytidylyltransferase/2-C-methyl-D-erythritol 2,4-cyclodiphosphate synthase [Microbacterium endophyticum]